MGNENSNAVSSVHTVNRDVNVTREGFMEKWGSFFPLYEKHWFMLFSDGMMVYMETPGDSEQLGHCNLSNSKMERKSPTTFEVTTTDKVWEFRCLNEGECTEWMDAIRTIVIGYLSPPQVAQLADLCFDQVISEMTRKDREYIEMSRLQSIIRSVFMKNDIDSLNVQLMHEFEFGYFMTNQIPQSFRPSRCLWSKLQEKVKSVECLSLNWKHIVHAVAHEMTEKLAQIIHSLSADLGDLECDSADELVTAINTKTKRNLTSAETQYLRSLIRRATHLTPSPIADRS